MNKKYIKPSSERVTIFTEGNVANIAIGSGSGDGQDVRRHDINDSWDDWEDEELADE